MRSKSTGVVRRDGWGGEVDEPSGRVALPGSLRALWVCSIVVVGVAVIVGWLKWHGGESRSNWDPLSDPLYGDLMEYPGTYTLLHTSAFFFNVRAWPYPFFSAVAYPPFAAMVMAPMYRLPVPEVGFVGVAVAWLAALVWWVSRWLIRCGVAAGTAILFTVTLLACSFPVLRLIHQGNIELVVWIFAACGVWAFWRGRDDGAAVLWGLAAAMKLFPLVLLLLLLPRGRWRAFGIGVGSFVSATVFALWWLGPTMAVAWRGSLENVFGYQAARSSEWTMRELVANHSVFELVKVGAAIAGVAPGRLTLAYYGLGAGVLAMAFFGRLWKMPRANQLLGVSVFMVMFPPISYYHSLVHLYAPVAVLGMVAMEAGRAGIRVRGLQGTMMLFVPLFAPFTVLTFRRELVFCGLVQGVVLVVLFGCALRFPFGLRVDEAETLGA